MTKQMKVYKDIGIRHMNSIEQLSGSLMSDKYAVLEDRFWECVDDANDIAIGFVIDRMAEILDDLQEGMR